MPHHSQRPPLPAPGAARRARALTLAAMSLGYAVVQLDVTIVNTALATIGNALGGGISKLQGVVTAYTVAFAAFILTAGALGDRLGAKRMFLAGFATFTAASLWCALAPSAGILIVARAIQGIGAAILVPNSLALLNHAFPETVARGRAVSVWAAGASLALTAGPLAGGALIAGIGWRSIFLVNVPIGLAGLGLAWRYASESAPAPHHELDLPGQVSAVGALGLLAGAIIEGGVLGFAHPAVIAGLGGSALLTVLFVRREQRAHQPMLPLALFGERMFSLLSAVGVLVNIPFYGLIFVLSLYFQQVNGLSPFATGAAFVPTMGAVLVTNLVAAHAAQRFGALRVIASGALIAAVGCLGLLGIARGTSYVAMCAQLVALGAGLGLLVPPLTSALLGSIDKARSGVAAGVLNSARQTGSVLGVALFGSFIGGAHGFIPGARVALALSTVLMAGAAAATLNGSRGAPGH